MVKMKAAKGLVLGLSGALGLLLVGCSDKVVDDNDNGASNLTRGEGVVESDGSDSQKVKTKPEFVTGADSERIYLSDEIPNVSGFSFTIPGDEDEAATSLCDAADWWLDKDVSPDDRKLAAPFILDVANDYNGSESAIVSDISNSSIIMVRSGFDVGDRLNKGQGMIVRSCGLFD